MKLSPVVLNRAVLAAASLVVLCSQSARAASATWSATPTNGNWVATSGQTNWSTGAATFPGVLGSTTNGDTATFTGSSTKPVITLPSNLNVGSITFANAVDGAYKIGAAVSSTTLTVSNLGAITNSNQNATATNETINTALQLGGGTSAVSYTFDASGATGDLLNIAGNVKGGTSAKVTLTLQGSNTGANTISGVILDQNSTVGVAVIKTGAGTWALSGANSYSGGTTVKAGTMYADNAGGASFVTPTALAHSIVLNNTTTSATGSGTVTVGNGGTLGGSGTIMPGTGSGGVVLQSGGNLASGDVQSNASPFTAGQGLSINNTAGLSSALSINAGATLTFALGAGTNTIGAYTFDAPNINSTYLSVAGNTPGEINFATSGSKMTINLVDLTAVAVPSATLSLRTSNPYLLIQTGSNLNFNLVTTGGYDANGYVLGTSADGGLTVDTQAFAFEVTNLSGSEIDTPTNFNGLQLYLYNGDLEVVPEPGTWAMMLGGLALLLLIQRRKSKVS